MKELTKTPTEMVSISKEDFDNMSSRLEKLETKFQPPIAKKVKDHYATLRRWQNMLVVDDMRDVRESWEVEPDGNKIKKLYCTLVVFDGKATKELNKVDVALFRRDAEQITVRLVETIKEEIEQIDGTLPVVEVDDFTSKVVGETPNIVMAQKIKYVIEMPDGTKMNIKSGALNL